MPRAARAANRILEIVAGDRHHRIGLEGQERAVPTRRSVRSEHQLEDPIGSDDEVVAVIDGPDDPLRVPAVSGPAVDRQRQVRRVTPPAAHPVRTGRIDGRVLVVRVGVVATPLLVRPDDVHEPWIVGVGPHVAVQCHLQDREHPLVALEDLLVIGDGSVTVQEAGVEGTEDVEQLVDGFGGLKAPFRHTGTLRGRTEVARAGDDRAGRSGVAQGLGRTASPRRIGPPSSTSARSPPRWISAGRSPSRTTRSR